jgi:hypothetical protein
MALRSDLKEFQRLLLDPAALSAAASGLPARDQARVFELVLRLNALGPKLSQFGSLPESQQKELLRELETLIATAKSLSHQKD